MRNLASDRKSAIDAPFEMLLRSDEWGPLVRFVDGWFKTPISEATGVSSAKLDQLEQKIGRTLPPCLREWYCLVGQHDTFLDETTQDYEVPLARVGESPRLLRIYAENQEVWYCGILEEHRTIPNPPVYFDSHTFDPQSDAGYDPSELVDGHFIRVSDTLTAFLFAMAIRQAVIRLKPAPSMKSGVSGAFFGGYDLDIIREQFRIRRVLDFPAGFSPEYGEEVILADDWGLAARTSETFKVVERAIKQSGGELKDRWVAK
jgi:hypothetical protein